LRELIEIPVYTRRNSARKSARAAPFVGAGRAGGRSAFGVL